MYQYDYSKTPWVAQGNFGKNILLPVKKVQARQPQGSEKSVQCFPWQDRFSKSTINMQVTKRFFMQYFNISLRRLLAFGVIIVYNDLESMCAPVFRQKTKQHRKTTEQT